MKKCKINKLISSFTNKFNKYSNDLWMEIMKNQQQTDRKFSEILVTKTIYLHSMYLVFSLRGGSRQK